MRNCDVSAVQGGVKVSKTLLKTAARYLARIKSGERIMRDAHGKMHWTDGRSVGRKTVSHMLETGDLAELDTDLFGDYSRGQTLGCGER